MSESSSNDLNNSSIRHSNEDLFCAPKILKSEFDGDGSFNFFYNVLEPTGEVKQEEFKIGKIEDNVTGCLFKSYKTAAKPEAKLLIIDTSASVARLFESFKREMQKNIKLNKNVRYYIISFESAVTFYFSPNEFTLKKKRIYNIKDLNEETINQALKWSVTPKMARSLFETRAHNIDAYGDSSAFFFALDVANMFLEKLERSTTRVFLFTDGIYNIYAELELRKYVSYLSRNPIDVLFFFDSRYIEQMLDYKAYQNINNFFQRIISKIANYVLNDSFENYEGFGKYLFVDCKS